MDYKKDPDRLFLYITLSLALHLILFLLFPYGELRVLGDNTGEQEYGFIQMVEYSVEVPDISQDNNKSNSNENIPVEDRVEESEIEEEEQKSSIDEDIEIPEPETIEEEVIEEAVIEEKEIIVEKIEKAEEIVEDKNLIEDSTIGNSLEDEIITSEESDLEIEMDKSSTDDLQTESTDTVATAEKEETPPPPPPPPTAGELIIGAPRVAYPKDLVGKAITGLVELQVHISSSGIIEVIEITKTSGIEQMDRVARLTIEHGWQFAKYQQPYSMIITVDFQIDANGNPEVKVSQGNLVFK